MRPSRFTNTLSDGSWSPFRFRVIVAVVRVAGRREQAQTALGGHNRVSLCHNRRRMQMGVCTLRIVRGAAVAAALSAAGCGNPISFAAVVDDYLDQFARRHPSIAAGNGIHAHDDQLEDFSPASIKEEIEWLRSVRRTLDAMDPSPLSADERVDRRILQGVVDGWLLDLDTARTWSRNPMIYASAISDGVHNLMRMESSPAE